MNRKLSVIIAIAASLLIYLVIGVPWLISLVETNGILVAFPVFLLFYSIFAYLIGAVVKQGPRAFALFLFAFLLGDIIMPPILVSMSGAIPPLASQQLASDVFFFTLYTNFGAPVVLAYWLTY